jgi:uncharacterized protein with HEPN domain
MTKDNTVYLKNIVDKAQEVIEFTSGVSAESFLNNNMLQSAVILKLIIIGEESRKLPSEMTSEIDLPWKMIGGFRNMAVHEYFDLDLNQVWVTVKEDVPDLLKKIEAYLKMKT